MYHFGGELRKLKRASVISQLMSKRCRHEKSKLQSADELQPSKRTQRGASRPSASPCGCPAIQNRAHFPREGIPIRRRICLAPNARADCAIQFAALHQQACAWLL